MTPHPALLLAALAAAPVANAAAPPVAADAPARPYFDCMVRSVRHYAPKAGHVSEAIDAAKAQCADDMLRLKASFVVDHLQAGDAPEVAERVADIAQRKLDAQLHDYLVQAALDAR